MSRAKLTAKYSGAHSLLFWRRINSLPSPRKEECYALGCVLQNVERDVLRWLECAEDDESDHPTRSR